ncbi:MAG TPA: hypothetical protein VHL11_03295 [Phototrophicaceae bacterium]|jgi:hypothetical protein|nr:hypothetical protein [Phototrophicaceae bacterium]
MTDDDLFDLNDEDLDSDADPFAGATPIKAAVRSLEDFDAEVDRQIKVLMSTQNDAKLRREAAYWLGESGAPKAITALRKIYEKDKKNKSVQQAAEYALGQFKALDEAILRDPGEPVAEALGKPENEAVVDLLESIALHDNRGKRLRIKTRTLVLIEALLAIVLAVLVVLNLTMVGTRKVDPGAKVAMRGEGSITERTLNELGLRAGEIKTDAEELQRQLNGTTPNCKATFVEPAEFVVNAEAVTNYPSVQPLVDRYNRFQADLTGARAPFDTACQANKPVDAAAAANSMTTLISVLAGIPAFQTDVTTAQADFSVTATAGYQATLNMKFTLDTIDATNAASTEEPTAAFTETPTETPGLTTTQLRTHTSALYNLIDQATGNRGFNSLLNEYWTEARDQGTTTSCRNPRPAIPDDYVLPEDVIALAPELVSAVEQLNTGLQTDRDGWDFFERSCVNGTTLQNFNLGLNSPTLAKLAFDSATTILDQLTGANAPSGDENTTPEATP